LFVNQFYEAPLAQVQESLLNIPVAPILNSVAVTP